MPERHSNLFTRVAAAVALVAALVLVAYTVLSSEEDSSDKGDRNGDNGTLQVGQPTPQGERAMRKGFYIVEEGDTLAQIASDTGLDLDQLVELNPQLDPQALIAGDKVRLR